LQRIHPFSARKLDWHALSDDEVCAGVVAHRRSSWSGKSLNMGVTSKLIATALGLCGFAVAILAGLAAGNDTARILTTAIVCMIICQFAGLAVGILGERVVSEHLETYRKQHPIPGAAGEPSAPLSKSSPPLEQNS
jgi:tetrahydromethanopterin S-methyltransferase subunit C